MSKSLPAWVLNITFQDDGVRRVNYIDDKVKILVTTKDVLSPTSNIPDCYVTMTNKNSLSFAITVKSILWRTFIGSNENEMYFPSGDVIYYVVFEWCWMMLVAHLLVTACIRCSSTNRTSFHGTILDSENSKCKHKQK